MDKQTILAGWLIDGTGAPAAENVLITVGAGRIISIDPAVSETPCPGGIRLDLRHCTLLPALCDCHTHLTLSGTLDSAIRNARGLLEYEALETIITKHIEEYLSHGVISVRDGGDSGGYVLRYTTDLKRARKMPFGLHTPGPAWHREGRYGKFIGRAVPTGKDPKPEMEEWIGKGIDHIKVIQSGINSLSTFGSQTAPQFEKDFISRTFGLCRSGGIGLMVHANGEKPVGIAIDGGCDSIEHGFFMGDENLKKMSDARITWIPTAVTMKAYAEHARVDSIESQVARRTLDHQLGQLHSARRYGVRVALGTDAGSPGVYHGKAVGEELQLFVSAGYSIEEAIHCATMNAMALMKNEEAGRLKPGDPATFVAVKGTPAQVPERLSDIDMIMVSGRPIASTGQKQVPGVRFQERQPRQRAHDA